MRWRTMMRPAGATALLGLTLITAPNAGGDGGYGDGGPLGPNPCKGKRAKPLRCPDLQMAKPSEMYATRGGGSVLLHATNNIKSRGEGPLEVRGRRNGRRNMEVKQAIHTSNGKRRFYETRARLRFYFIPGQGRYWKFHEAARFEVWSRDPKGRPGRRLRTGPKLNYCFRDLERTRPSKRSPAKPVYPACSQNPRARKRTLGTSVGWSDIYPSTYHENWVNVTGLRGCFLLLHRADPRNNLYESKEQNNTRAVAVKLPPAASGRVRSC